MCTEKQPNDGRRNFFKICIGGMSLASAGMVGYPIVSFMALPTKPGADKPVELALADLMPGQAQYVQFRGEQLIVLGTDEGPRVLSASCPHLGCNVIWDAADGMFRCPCHGAFFDSAGNVVKGPVSSPLKAIAFEIKDGKLIIS
jgi:Rieske Fe-S protein